jgi:hypothetical protein
MTTLAQVITAGLYAALPAPGMAGRTYYATDTSQTWYDNGTAWENVTEASTGSTQTTVAGSVSGSAVFSQPSQGNYSKKILIYLDLLSGNASYTFPAPFTVTPEYFIGASASGAAVTALSTAAVTVFGAPSTGFIVLEGY